MSTNIRWTLEKLQAEALKYRTRSEFMRGNNPAYQSAFRRGCLDIICSHMPKRVDVSGKNNANYKWTDEMLASEALKYTTRYGFQKGSPAAYVAARDRGILDNICTHMPRWVDRSGINNPVFIWTLEKLQAEALKYNSRSEFKEKSYGAYQAANSRNLLDQICSHMKRSRNTSKPEEDLMSILRQSFPNLIKKTFKVSIYGKPHMKRFQVDILDLDTMLGIEYDGQHHHSEKFLIEAKTKLGWTIEEAKNYHKIKNDALWDCHGVKILHIKGDDWKNNKQNCVDRCLVFLNSKNEIIT
jgi:very-short-patch-repair endonuclease